MVEVFETRAATGIHSVVELGTEIAVKGGGVAAGLMAGSKIGKFAETNLAKPVTPTSPMTDKIWAGVANNAPKAVVAYGAAKLLLKPGATGVVHDFVLGGVFGLAGDIVVDGVARLTNQGAPTAIVGDTAKVQTLLAENAELKAALEKMSAGLPVVKVEGVPYGIPIMPTANIKDIIEKRYQAANPTTTAPVSTEQRYAFAGRELTSPDVMVAAFGFTRGD